MTGTLLAAVAVGGVAFGLTSRPSASATTFLTDQVTRATVQKTISDSGTVVDQYTYSVSPESDPVLTARDGVTVGKAPGVGGYTVSSLEVAEGDRVEKDEVLAVVVDANDEETEVKAPFDAWVRSVPTAEDASAATVAVLGVGRREVVVTVSEYDVIRLERDQEADLRLDASGATFDGTIRAISQTAETSSGVQTYQVTFRTPNLPEAARTGMTVSATIALTSKANVLTVPLTAVSGGNGNATVQVVDKQGVAQTRSIVTGLVGDSRVEITRGLAVGEKVVTGISGAAPSATASAPNTPGPPPGVQRGGN